MRFLAAVVFSVLVGLPALGAQDRLVLISPHRESLQNAFIPAFERYYKARFQKEVEVAWLDQGGAESDVRFVKARFQGNSQTAGIDVFWGGGDMNFIELERSGMLQPYPLGSEHSALPKEVAGLALRSASGAWYATAISSFGIFFNKRLLGFQALPEPTTWADLAKPLYRTYVSVADPRRSSSSLVMNLIMLYSHSWEEAWEILTGMAGNVRKFTHSSSDPIKAVVAGDAMMATAIDFYAFAKIAGLGRDNLGFNLPPAKTVLSSDPVAILRGAPNRLVAQRFVDYLLSPAAQKLLIFPRNHKKGPTNATLGRMAVNPLAYDGDAGIISQNPFQLKAPEFSLKMTEVARVKKVFGDLVGAVHVDTHKLLKKAWAAIARKPKSSARARALLLAPPLSRDEFMKLPARWNDQVLRNRLINDWVTAAAERYRRARQLAEEATS